MPPINPTNSRVRVSTTSGGTYTNVGYVTSYDVSEGSEGDSTTYYFGGELNRAGNPTLTGTINVLWDMEDTTGQTILRSAKKTGDPIWLQLAHAGTATGAKVEQFEAIITEVPRSSDAGGDNVTGSFSFRGTPSTLSEVTLA
jgi:hypothetical protein